MLACPKNVWSKKSFFAIFSKSSYQKTKLMSYMDSLAHFLSKMYPMTGSEVRVSLRESIWILAEDFCENPLNPFFSLKFRASLHGEISSRILTLHY